MLSTSFFFQNAHQHAVYDYSMGIRFLGCQRRKRCLVCMLMSFPVKRIVLKHEKS